MPRSTPIVYEYCGGKIIRLHFSSPKKMCIHLLRFQEYYESKEFAGKPFTLGQYREWYKKVNKKWDYYNIVKGCNMPSSVFNVFKGGLFDPLSKEERYILDIVKNKRGRYYVIGTCSEDETLDHELIHGLFYVDNNYRKKVIRYLRKNMDRLKLMHGWMKEYGYSNDVFLDEVNAYLSCDSGDLKKRGLSYPEELCDKLHNWKEEIFKEKGIT